MKASELLDQVLSNKEIEEAFLIGRDGFVIESRGSEVNVDLDTVGASVAGGVSKILHLETELKAEKFKEMYVEFEDKILVCVTVGDIFLAVASASHSSLATIRFKLKRLLPESIEF
jgi:predicted regulator of Ras-like GTPase activity (Roadblock/LC7/MglB family)